MGGKGARGCGRGKARSEPARQRHDDGQAGTVEVGDGQAGAVEVGEG